MCIFLLQGHWGYIALSGRFSCPMTQMSDVHWTKVNSEIKAAGSSLCYLHCLPWCMRQVNWGWRQVNNSPWACITLSLTGHTCTYKHKARHVCAYVQCFCSLTHTLKPYLSAARRQCNQQKVKLPVTISLHAVFHNWHNVGDKWFFKDKISCCWYYFVTIEGAVILRYHSAWQCLQYRNWFTVQHQISPVDGTSEIQYIVILKISIEYTLHYQVSVYSDVIVYPLF